MAQLRHPQVLRMLGEVRQHRLLLDELASMATGVRLCDPLVVLGYRPGRLDLGDGVHVREGTILAFGDDAGGFGRIRIGHGTWIGQYNNQRASEGGDIVIGEACLVSQFCTLVGSQHAHAAGSGIAGQGAAAGRKGIVVGNDVWLGAGVVVTPGVTIGDGAVVGANAVVTRSIPAGEIWAGVPARRIGQRE